MSRNDSREKIAGTARSVLDRYEFFPLLTEEQQQALLADATEHELAKDTFLLETGRNCDDVLFVGRGNVRVFVTGENGRDVTLYYIEPGGSCPINMSSALFRQPAAANAITTDNVLAITLPGRSFRELVSDSHSLRDFALVALAGRFEEMISRIREIKTRPVDERLAEFLLTAFEDMGVDQPDIAMTQQEIAMAIGSVREVVSRRLRELDRRGVISVSQGKIRLIDHRRLNIVARPAVAGR